MTPGDWDRIKRIFTAALGVPSAERDAYVRTADDNEDIRRAVHDLLRAHYDASKTFLEHKNIVFAAPWLFRDGDRVANRFVVTRRIARGAMGEVYEVYDEQLRLQVALKAIRPELVGDAETAERFRREVLVTRDIAHEGLCRVFDFVEHEAGENAALPPGTRIPCLTMQLLDGESLEEWLATRRPVPSSEALPLLEQIAGALQVLHEAGIVHRDLKPSNVMLVKSATGMRAVLTDFGLAKPLDQSVFETEVKAQGGAPFFMAPELFRGERPSHASDIYAFGLLIDEMITSRRAFASDSLHALLLQKLGEGPERPSLRCDDMPAAWERAILRCLSSEPRHRFQSPAAVLTALTEPDHWSRWTPWAPAHARSRTWRLSIYAAATVVVLMGAAALARPVQGTTPRSVFIGNFANLTNNRDFDYLSAGTAGELALKLGRVPALRVYRQPPPAARIPRSQGPAFSLHGDVQAAQETLRIRVNVTDLADGAVLWTRTFEGTRDRSLELETDLAADTAAALLRLNPEGEPGAIRRAILAIAEVFGSRAQLPSAGTANGAAFDAYLRGRVLFEDRTLAPALHAIELLKRAVSLDPNFAAAYATLADVYGVLMDLHYAPHSTLIAQAEQYANRAVELAPELPEAQLSIAAVRQMQWRWDESDAAYRRAIELHPTFARAHRWHGGLLLQFGEFEEALALYRRSLELDPYDYPSQSAYGHALFYAGRAPDAAAHLERVLNQRDLFYAHALLGQVYAYLAGVESADRDAYLRKALEQSAVLRVREAGAPGSTAVTEYADLVGALAWSYAGETANAAPFLERLEGGRARGRVSPAVLARVYAAQRDTDRALEALLQAESQKDRELFYVAVSPHYASIRDEPQFRALVDRLHLNR